jgi:hypothetical protein
MLNTAQQIGGAIGLAVLSVLADSATNSALAAGDSQVQARVHGFHHALQVSAGFALAASLTALLLIRNRRAAAVSGAQ